MPHLAQAASQSAADFSEAFGLSELTEKHGIEMVPRVELFGKPFGFMSMNQSMEFFPVNKSNELTEQACMLYHGASSLSGFVVISLVIITLPYKDDFFSTDF